MRGQLAFVDRFIQYTGPDTATPVRHNSPGPNSAQLIHSARHAHIPLNLNPTTQLATLGTACLRSAPPALTLPARPLATHVGHKIPLPGVGYFPSVLVFYEFTVNLLYCPRHVGYN